jgi:hypothetical protein
VGVRDEEKREVERAAEQLLEWGWGWMRGARGSRKG